MSETRNPPETVEDALGWVEQLHEDIRHADFSTAAEESLPQVEAFLERKGAMEDDDE